PAASGWKWSAGGTATSTFCGVLWSSAARHRYPALTAAATSADSRTAFGVSTGNSLQSASDGLLSGVLAGELDAVLAVLLGAVEGAVRRRQKPVDGLRVAELRDAEARRHPDALPRPERDLQLGERAAEPIRDGPRPF